MASPSTLSPRNSRRSYDCERSSAHDACVNACRRLSSGRLSISSRRERSESRALGLLVRRDVVDGLTHGLNRLSVLVRDLDPELVLELHDELHEVERVGVQILLKGRFLCDLALFDPELLGQHFLHTLVDLLARSCHLVPYLPFSRPQRTADATTLSARDSVGG